MSNKATRSENENWTLLVHTAEGTCTRTATIRKESTNKKKELVVDPQSRNSASLTKTKTRFKVKVVLPGALTPSEFTVPVSLADVDLATASAISAAEPTGDAPSHIHVFRFAVRRADRSLLLTDPELTILTTRTQVAGP